MNKYIILVFAICALLFLWYFVLPSVENFLPIKTNIHVEIDKDGYPLEYSTQTPHQNGKEECTKVACPKLYDNDLMCWKC
jgi:hypothetical protein